MPVTDIDSQGEPTRTDVLDDLAFFEFTHTCGRTLLSDCQQHQNRTGFSNYTVVGQEGPTHTQLVVVS